MISVFSKMLSRRPHLIPPEAGKGTTRSHYLPTGRLAFRRAEKIKLFESAERRNEVDVVVMKFSKEMSTAFSLVIAIRQRRRSKERRKGSEADVVVIKFGFAMQRRLLSLGEEEGR